MLETKKEVIGGVQCHVYDESLSLDSQNLSCWELAERNNDFCFEYKVCQDCLVYKYATAHVESAREHFEDILLTRNYAIAH